MPTSSSSSTGNRNSQHSSIVGKQKFLKIEQAKTDSVTEIHEMRDSTSQQADNVWLVVCCCHLTRGSHSCHQHCPTKLGLSKTWELSNLGKATQVFCKGQWGTTTTPPRPPKKLWVALRERERAGWLVVQSPVAWRFNFNSTKTGFVSDPVVLCLTAV